MQGREQDDAAAPPSRLVHDLHQPLSAINTYAQAGMHMIDSGIADTALLKELLGKIVTQCERATSISRELGETMTTRLFENDPS